MMTPESFNTATYLCSHLIYHIDKFTGSKVITLLCYCAVLCTRNSVTTLAKRNANMHEVELRYLVFE